MEDMDTRRRRPGVAATAVALGVSVVLFSACGDLSRGELRRGVESLGALAAQGGLIADGVARDATRSTYARVMARTLGEQAEHESEKLADAEPSPGIAKEQDTAVRIAGDLADLFSELQTFPGDEHEGALVRRHMNEVGERADALADRLSEEPK
jgi:hypothetical protein